MNYAQLSSWRNLCEYLNGQWYKFAEPEDIKKNVRCLPTLYDPKCKIHRRSLFDDHLIQFIHWTQHPILNYRSGRRTKSYYDERGWQLCSYWEHKIDYLEKIILFGDEPVFKPWESSLNARISERKRRQDALELKRELAALKESEYKAKCQELNICWQCNQPLVFMMIDCVKCGATQ
jgi:hypothetical protein